MAQATPPTVLIAEDDFDVRDLISRVVENAGYRPYHATDGETASRLVAERRPALVITDITMPRTDGLELCRLVRRDPGLNDTPILIVSARVDEASRAAGFAAGADEYLAKPFSLRDLTEVIARLRIRDTPATAHS